MPALSLRRPLLVLLPVLASITGQTLCAHAAAGKDEPTLERCIEAHERAQVLQKRGQLVEADRQLETCAASTCPQAVAVECAGLKQEVKAALPTIVIGARSTSPSGEVEDLVDLEVSLDGQPLTGRLDGRAVPVDPGEHVVRLSPAGRPPIERRIVVRQAEKNRPVMFDVGAVAAPSAPTSERSLGPGFWAAAGVGVAGLASFTGFGLAGRAKESELDDCKPMCLQSDVDDMRRSYWIADLSLLAGVLATGAAAWLALRGPRAGVEAAPAVDPRGGVSFSVRGLF